MKYKKNENIVCESFDEESIVYNPSDEQFYIFEGISLYIWNSLDCVAIPDMIQHICMQFDVDSITVENDINAFLNELIEKKLIRSSSFEEMK